MATRQLKSQKRPVSPSSASAAVEYAGKRTKTGNSMGFRFEGALFKSHPEFSGEVRAHVIAPGRLLITTETTVEDVADPVIASFLAFLKQDMVSHPGNIRPLDESLTREIGRLTSEMSVDRNEDLGDVDLL